MTGPISTQQIFPFFLGSGRVRPIVHPVSRDSGGGEGEEEEEEKEEKKATWRGGCLAVEDDVQW